MRNVYFLFCILSFLVFSFTNSNAQGSCIDGGYQWSDVATIFENNGCAAVACHGGGAGGLDLTSYAGFNTGGTKCTTEIASGTTLADIILVGGVTCAGGTVINAMGTLTPAPVPQADVDAIQAWIGIRCRWANYLVY